MNSKGIDCLGDNGVCIPISTHSIKTVKKHTNADKIRSMSDEELAEFFSILDHSCLDGECFICFGVNYISDDERSILDWLQSEAE